MAKLADAADLKSAGAYPPWGFKSPSGHQYKAFSFIRFTLKSSVLVRCAVQWVNRYKYRIHYWEILNEPSGQHFDLTLPDYVEKILKPSYRVIKAADPQAKALPCGYNELPSRRSDAPDARGREAFWE